MSGADTIYLVEVGSEQAGEGERNTVGGWPVLDAGRAWPVCDCGERMVLFFQVDVPADIAVFGGDHLLVFQCPKHNDACFPPSSRRLPEGFWDAPPDNDMRFWQILLHKGNTRAAEADAYLQPHRLILTRAEERIDEHGRGRPGFKLGGVPAWAQDPEHYICRCGAALAQVCQVPEDFGFDKRPERPSQPYTFHDDQYGLFLGNEVYIVACPEHCDPAAAWPIAQN
ncbi:hypothetical protein [Kutzneria sp. NPDC051319]|uniref:hypothetical protein n=1 Tax=Kutzneria sp. NPDC051319 TaxID=3155047 RepID=UPI00343922F0